MKYLLFIILFACCSWQLPAQQPDRTKLRIADTLTTQEKTNRNAVILQSELDSLFREHDLLVAQRLPKEPEKPAALELPGYFLWSAIAALLLIAGLLYFLYRNQQRFTRTIRALHKQIQHLEWLAQAAEKPVSNAVTAASKGKASVASLEKRIQALTAELEQAEKQNQGLELVLNEYRHIKQEYESVKQQMMDVYKIRNYPGFAKDKSETEIVQGLLNTERAVAVYAYEHFLKPVIAIADANKNNPAKISEEERDRMLDLLLSLALLYTEYLYLRVNDLAVGGKMVERLGGLKNGNSVDLSLLKELNTEHGSRALTLRLVLDKMGIRHLSYPVFDETNLNLS